MTAACLSLKDMHKGKVPYLPYETAEIVVLEVFWKLIPSQRSNVPDNKAAINDLAPGAHTISDIFNPCQYVLFLFSKL